MKTERLLRSRVVQGVPARVQLFAVEPISVGDAATAFLAEELIGCLGLSLLPIWGP